MDKSLYQRGEGCVRFLSVIPAGPVSSVPAHLLKTESFWPAGSFMQHPSRSFSVAFESCHRRILKSGDKGIIIYGLGDDS